MARTTGTVVRWRDDRGFGFIKDSADESKEYYVHHTALQMQDGGFKALAADQLVEFDLSVQDDGKTRAENVTSVGGAPLPPGVRPAGDGGYGGGRGRGFGGGGDRGYGGGRGGGGDRSCFKCGQPGHMSRECPSAGGASYGGGGGDRNCFKCGQPGHMSRECPSGGGASYGGGGGDRNCFKCGQPGHMSRECPSGGGSYGGGRGGGRGGGGDRNCFKCGQPGHMSRECPSGGGY